MAHAYNAKFNKLNPINIYRNDILIQLAHETKFP